MFGMAGTVEFMSDRLLVTGAELTVASVRTALGGDANPLEIRMSLDESFARVLMPAATDALRILRRLTRGQGVDEEEATTHAAPDPPPQLDSQGVF